jgi:two-component system LytT family response regulator
MTLHAVIVDDEPLARERLKLLLRQEDDVVVVAEFGNGSDALAYLRSNEIDLLFLDIQMPERNGLEVIEELGIFGMPPTVFVTAYNEHAVRAFDMEAIDYLTKPVEPKRLKLSLDRVRKALLAKTALLTQAQFSTALREMRAVAKEPKRYLSRLLVKDGVKDLLVSAESIEWIEAADYYCGLHVNGRTHMLREPITELAGKLDPAIFLRVHRSAIVNLNYVQEIYREGREEGTVVLRDGQRLKMSKSGRLRLNQIVAFD